MAAAARQGQSHSIPIDIEEEENHAIEEMNETAHHAGVPAAPPLPTRTITPSPLAGRPTQEAVPIAAMIGNPDARRKLVLISLNTELDSHLRVLEHNETHRGSSTFRKVPSRLREGNESDFTPHVVSIGPHHNENNKFKEMHDTKLKYLDALIKRSEKNTLDRYVNAVNEKLESAVSMYSGAVTDNNQDFVKMMVLDGCFIIEFLRRWYGVGANCDMGDLKMKQPLLRNDLLLVENQIPFFILEDLFQVTDLPELNKMREEEGDVPITITELALVYFTGDPTGGKLMAQLFAEEKKSFDSLLHLFHTSLTPKYHSDLRTRMSDLKKEQLCSSSPFHCMFWFLIAVFGYLKVAYKYMCSTLHSSSTKIYAWIIKIMGFKGVARDRRRRLYGIPNARYLRDTGFRFRMKEATSFISDVTCTGKTIELPLLSVQETSLIQFRNLVAFEQCYPEHGHCFTAFATFLNYLIDAKEDVAILREYDIIQNRLGEDGKVADFFNGLLSGIYIENKHVPLFDHINEFYTRRYYQVTIYQWLRMLIPDFFTNPWAIPSMIAAFILLVLTMLQTFYTIYPYYHPK